MIQSVDRAVRILEALSDGAPGRLGVTELSQRLGLAKGTVHGLLQTLQAHRLIEQDSLTNRYGLGPALLELSSSYLDINELRARSLAWSELLALRTGESVRVAVPSHRGVLVIHHVFRPDSSVQILEVGAVLPLHATALGKVLLAFLPEAVIDEILAEELPRLTAHTLTDPDDVRAELDSVRQQCFAVGSEESVLGEAGIASPVFDRVGVVIGVIGIAGTTEILAPDRQPALAESVIEAARAVSRDLGAPAWPVLAAVEA